MQTDLSSIARIQNVFQVQQDVDYITVAWQFAVTQVIDRIVFRVSRDDFLGQGR